MKIRILFVLLLFFFKGSTLYAQSLFEFKYYFEENKIKESYQAFLLREDDGTGFIRVRFFDEKSKSTVIVDMLMQEHYGTDEHGKTDTNLLIFEGIDPVFISGDSSEAYDPDVFWFTKNEQTGFFEPLAVVSTNEEDNTSSEGIIEEMKLLEQKDLTKEFVLQYFIPKDDFYVNLFETKVRSVPTPQKSMKLFLIVVANTEDATIGTTCVKDKNAVYKNYEQIAKFLGIGFVPKEIFGTGYSKKNVEDAVNALAPGNNDIVIFYYSGHGFNSMKEGKLFPYMDLRESPGEFPTPGINAVNVEDVYKQIKMKGARLNLVISDCCNSEIGKTSNSSTNVASTRPSSIGWSLGNCMSLFMDSKPLSLLITAAEKGELSAGNDSDGGIFTHNFTLSVDKHIGLFFNSASWEEVVQMAKKQTISRANNTTCPQEDGTYQKCKQTPVYKKN